MKILLSKSNAQKLEHEISDLLSSSGGEFKFNKADEEVHSFEFNIGAYERLREQPGFTEKLIAIVKTAINEKEMDEIFILEDDIRRKNERINSLRGKLNGSDLTKDILGEDERRDIISSKKGIHFSKILFKLEELREKYKAEQSSGWLPTGITGDSGGKIKDVNYIENILFKYILKNPDDDASHIIQLYEAKLAEWEQQASNRSMFSGGGDPKSRKQVLTEALESIKNEQQARRPESSRGFNGTFNKICYDFIASMKEELGGNGFTELHALRGGPLKDIYEVLYKQLTVDFDPAVDYTNIYHQCIEAANKAAKETPDTRKGVLLDIARLIYENPSYPLQQMEAWLQHTSEGESGGMTELRKKVKSKSAQKDSPAQMRWTPKASEEGAGKADVNFGSNADAQSRTNIPGCRNPNSHNDFHQHGVGTRESAIPDCRFGTQARSVDGKYEVNPIYIIYLQELKRRYPDNLPMLYISNLRTTTNSMSDAYTEGSRNKALSDFSDMNSALMEFAIIPANTGFLGEKERNYKKESILLEDFKEELFQIFANNGQDFYLSQSFRERLGIKDERSCRELFEEMWREVKTETFCTGSDDLLISPAQRQQLAFHFFKHTLTDKLLRLTNPSRRANPCKDNIDRGAVHSAYYEIVSLLKEAKKRSQDPALVNEKIQKILRDIHAGSLLVKGRALNENYDALIHALNGLNREYFKEVWPHDLDEYLRAQSEHHSKPGYYDVLQKESDRKSFSSMPETTEIPQMWQLIGNSAATARSGSAYEAASGVLTTGTTAAYGAAAATYDGVAAAASWFTSTTASPLDQKSLNTELTEALRGVLLQTRKRNEEIKEFKLGYYLQKMETNPLVELKDAIEMQSAKSGEPSLIMKQDEGTDEWVFDSNASVLDCIAYSMLDMSAGGIAAGLQRDDVSTKFFERYVSPIIKRESSEPSCFLINSLADIIAQGSTLEKMLQMSQFKLAESRETTDPDIIIGNFQSLGTVALSNLNLQRYLSTLTEKDPSYRELLEPLRIICEKITKEEKVISASYKELFAKVKQSASEEQRGQISEALESIESMHSPATTDITSDSFLRAAKEGNVRQIVSLLYASRGVMGSKFKRQELEKDTGKIALHYIMENRNIAGLNAYIDSFRANELYGIGHFTLIDKNGNTPFHEMMKQNTRGIDNDEVVYNMLQAMADKLRSKSTPSYSSYNLSSAYSNGKSGKEALNALLIRNKEGLSPIEIAANNGLSKVVRFLIQEISHNTDHRWEDGEQLELIKRADRMNQNKHDIPGVGFGAAAAKPAGLHFSKPKPNQEEKSDPGEAPKGGPAP